MEVTQIKAAIITSSHPFLSTDKLKRDSGSVRNVNIDSMVITLSGERRTRRHRYCMKIAPSTAFTQMLKALAIIVEAAVTYIAMEWKNSCHLPACHLESGRIENARLRLTRLCLEFITLL
jgi:hypothetical protein